MVWGQAGKPHPQDPSNARKRIYKVFDRIEDTRSEETIYGSGLSGSARVPQNKAHRFSVSSTIQTKLAGTPASFNDLFGAPPQEKPKEKRPKKPLSKEEQAKKDFEKDMQQTLVATLFGRKQSWYILSVNQVFEAIHVHWGQNSLKLYTDTVIPLIFHKSIDSLRIGKLAEKARNTSVNLTNTGIAHQEVGWDPLRSFHFSSLDSLTYYFLRPS